MQRVKVYRLTSDGQWDDKGTGSVSVEYMEVSMDVVLQHFAKLQTGHSRSNKQLFGKSSFCAGRFR